MKVTALDRAQGCLLGHLAGDALGSLVEFKTADYIRCRYPRGVSKMADGGTWNTIAGQPTDDGEMMLTLAHSIVKCKRYDAAYTIKQYKWWLKSGPFDIGGTTRQSLTSAVADIVSQANGAMMRAAALGVACTNLAPHKAAVIAMSDCALTHGSIVCQDANALYVMALSHAIKTGCDTKKLYSLMLQWADFLQVDHTVLKTLRNAATKRPANAVGMHGWVQTAFQNAVYQMLHAPSMKACITGSIALGHDTDTNACIAGALYGALHGRQAIPKQWVTTLEQCKPGGSRSRPRPRALWPSNLDGLAAKLLGRA